MNNSLYDWVFHYNPYINQWEAARREHYTQIFSGGSDIIRSSSITTLMKIIDKTGGSISLLNELIKKENNE